MSDSPIASIVGDELVRVSPSQMQKFDDSQDQGCQRRWWFTKKALREDPSGPAAAKGTQVHARIEEYMNGGSFEALPILEKSMVRFAPAPGTPGMRMEIPIDSVGLKIEGVSVIGRMDVINDSGAWFDNEGVEHKTEPNELEVLDWKTTGNLQYAKTPGQLAKTLQMNVYAKAALSLRKVIDRVRISHGYGQVQRKPETLKVTKLLTVHEIETFWYANIVPLVRLMKHAARQDDFKAVKPNYAACHSFGKPCPFINDCSEDTLSAIIGTNNALPNPNNAANGGNTMSLLSKFNGSEQNAAVQVTEGVNQESSVLPPDAPPSDPVLAKAGAEGQFHKNAVGLYVVKDGQWQLAGAKSKADYEALVEGSRTSGGSPAVAPTPITPLTVPEAKRGRGRPRKVEVTEAQKQEVHAAQVPVEHIKAVVLDGAPVKQPSDIKTPVAPQPAGIMFWYNSIPSVPTQDLAGYVYQACAKIASNTGCSDIRASEHEALKFGKWRGILSAYVQQNPPPPNAYRLIGNDEVYEIVANALIPLCYLSTRGVK